MPNTSIRRQRTIEKEVLRRQNSDLLEGCKIPKRYIPSSRRLDRRGCFPNKNSNHTVDPNALAKIPLHMLTLHKNHHHQQANAASFSLRESAEAIRLPRMIRHERRMTGKATDVSVVFCVRRPGCGACRIHAQALVRMVASMDPSISLVGIVKHVKDVQAYRDFQHDYFGDLPIYRDPQWATFQALGNRKISTLKLLKLAPRMNQTYQERQVENVPLGGDIWTQGGILVLDRHANLRYVYYENYGHDLDLDEIRHAIQQARTEPLPRHVDRRYPYRQ